MSFDGRVAESSRLPHRLFAVGLQSEQIKLYNLRSFDKVINPLPSPPPPPVDNLVSLAKLQSYSLKNFF